MERSSGSWNSRSERRAREAYAALIRDGLLEPMAKQYGLALCVVGRRIADASPSFLSVLGRTGHPKTTLALDDILSEEDVLSVVSAVGSRLMEPGVRSCKDVRVKGQEGTVVLEFEVVDAKPTAHDGICAVLAATDVTAARSAENDPQTGLLTLGVFRERAKRLAEVTKKRRQDGRSYLAFGDLNNLKAYNDTVGHDAADHVIAGAANVLRWLFARKEDLVSRRSGDEFLVGFHAPDEGAAKALLTSAMSVVKVIPGNNGVMSLSLGFVEFVEGRSLLEAEQLAEAAMYYCKFNSIELAVSYSDIPTGWDKEDRRG